MTRIREEEVSKNNVTSITVPNVTGVPKVTDVPKMT